MGIEALASPLMQLLPTNPFKVLGGLFGGGAPDPYKVRDNQYIVNGAKGGRKQLGGSFDPTTGQFTFNNPGNRDFSAQMAALQAYLNGGPKPTDKNLSRFVKAIDASGYRQGAAQANAISGPTIGPQMPFFQQQIAPQVMATPSMFARPEAMQLFQSMFPQQQQPPQGQPAPGAGMMYSGGSPTFNEAGPNPFASMLQAGMPGPAPDKATLLSRYAGILGNGGGELATGQQRGSLPLMPIKGLSTMR